MYVSRNYKGHAPQRAILYSFRFLYICTCGFIYGFSSKTQMTQCNTVNHFIFVWQTLANNKKM